MNKAQKFLAKSNKRYSREFVEIEFGDELKNMKNAPIRAFQNNRFLVQLFNENGFLRLSINRTMQDRKGEWLDKITWDELQNIKDSVGFADYDAIEVYPKKKDIVNVHNLRHLWISYKPLDFVWRSKP